MGGRDTQRDGKGREMDRHTERQGETHRRTGRNTQRDRQRHMQIWKGTEEGERGRVENQETNVGIGGHA